MSTTLPNSFFNRETPPPRLRQLPYGTITIDGTIEACEPSSDIDNAIMILPASARPNSALVDGEIVLVQFDPCGCGLTWLDEQGRLCRVGSEEQPLAQPLRMAAQTDDGLLVGFMDERDACPPDEWIIFKAEMPTA